MSSCLSLVPSDRCSFRCVNMQPAQVRLQQSSAGESVMKHHPSSCSSDPLQLCSFNRITEIASLSPKIAHVSFPALPSPPRHAHTTVIYLFILAFYWKRH